MGKKGSLEIEGVQIGVDNRTFVIGEVAQAHDGSLGTAHAYIDALAKAGVDAVKFQTHIARAESSPDEKFRVNVFPQDATRYDYWQRMEFSPEQWRGLSDHAKQRDLVFLSSPFSIEAVELLDALGMPAWKVASGEVTNIPMIRKMARTGKPILLSSGMSSWSELDEAVATVEACGAPVALFQCTTAYPCPPDKIGLNVISELRSRYGFPVGLSDHSGTIFPSLAAVSQGANLIEVHAVFSRDCFGPDVGASLTISEISQLVEGIRFTEKMLSSPVDKELEARASQELKLLFGKSLYVKGPLASGHRLKIDDVILRKPGTGMPARMLEAVVGMRLTRDYAAGEPLVESDLDA